jgi:hypothetical protein
VRRTLIPTFIFIAVLLGLIAAYAVYLSSIAPRLVRNHKVLESASDVRLSLTIAYDSGPIAQEKWSMRDRDGLSTIGYKALGRNGIQVAIDEQPTRELTGESNVAFLFGKLVQDGLWDLPSKPPRGDTNAHYTIDVYQLIDNLHGGRKIAFTDPKYWATTGGRQYTIHLDPKGPRPDLLHMSSTVLVEPRYGELVADFRAFGPASFLSRIVAEKKRRFGVSAS